MIQVSARFESLRVNLVAAPDLQMRVGGRGGNPDPEIRGRPSLKTKVFWLYGPQFGLIIREVRGPSPGSATATVLYSRKQVK